MIAGIEVGQITSVQLEDGHAVVGMNIEPKYAPVIRADAQLAAAAEDQPPGHGRSRSTRALRSAEPMADGTHDPARRAPQPNVNPDEFLARLDGDTRRLPGPADPGRGGGARRSRQAALARPAPARAVHPLHRRAQRRARQAPRRRSPGSIHDFGLLTEELGRHDAEITRFVSASSDALGGFADQQDAIRARLAASCRRRCETTRGALDSANTLSTELRPTLTELIPQAQALQPGLEATRRVLLDDTTPILRDQLRPFTRQVRPVVTPHRAAGGPARQDGRPVRQLARSRSTTASTSSPTTPARRTRASSSTCPGSTTT